MLLEGLQLPLTTPFYSDGRLNLRKLEQNVAAYSKTPVAGIVVLSEQGEPAALSDEETLEALRTAVGAAAAEKVMLAGASRASVRGTLAVADHAGSLGYDAVLIGQPVSLRGNGRADRTKELLTYFQTVADRSAIPVVLSSADAAHGGPLPMEVILELVGHPRIIGLVEGKAGLERIANLRTTTASVKREATVTSVFAAVTGRMLARHAAGAAGAVLSADMLTGSGPAVAVASTTSILKTRTKSIGFQILVGNTTQMLDGLSAGAVGAVSAFSACAPQACYEVFAAWKDGDGGLAEEKQARLQAAASRIEEELGVSGIKFGCDLNGYFGGLPRLPLLPPGGEEREEIETLMRGLRN
jgi:4-hydroxy-2-oxoglutarate aldolase